MIKTADILSLLHRVIDREIIPQRAHTFPIPGHPLGPQFQFHISKNLFAFAVDPDTLEFKDLISVRDAEGRYVENSEWPQSPLMYLEQEERRTLLRILQESF